MKWLVNSQKVNLIPDILFFFFSFNTRNHIFRGKASIKKLRMSKHDFHCFTKDECKQKLCFYTVTNCGM